ncbi:MAG: metallophosphoesterase [Hyphomicrobium sp.]|nr:MAG: metallophosphoesterase [Hyphomicrobium sp.]
MTFRFIHSADWHIGKPFRSLPDRLSGELATARIDAIDRIAAIARARAASHVLVAGDVFDGPDLPRVEIRRALERMAQHSSIQWLLMPGNHDPLRMGGIWDRVRQLDLPNNILVLATPEPIALAPNVVLLPAPLTSNNPGDDPSRWMETARTQPGVARIGLAHGSVQGFGSDGDSAVLIAADRALRAGLDYLALGDWHGTRSITANTWYAGTPEPDRFPDNDPGNVLCVTVESGGKVSVEKVRSSHFTWAKINARLQSCEDLDGVDRELSSLSDLPRNLLVKLQLAGSLSLADHGALDVWREGWSARLKWLDVEHDGLIVRPTVTDFDVLKKSPALLEVAQRLSHRVDGDDKHNRDAASLALLRLYGFAAEAVNEAQS